MITEDKKTPFLRKITPYDKEGQAGQIRFVLSNGSELVVKIDEISEPNRTHAAYHGISQRIGDSAAGCSKDSAFDYALECMTAVYDQLKTPDWSRPAQTGKKPETETELTDLIAVIAKLKKLPEESVSGIVRESPREKRDEWRKNRTIALELAAIALKRLKAAPESGSDFDFPAT